MALTPIDIYYSAVDLGAVTTIAALSAATKQTVSPLTINLAPEDEFEDVQKLSGTISWNTEERTMEVNLTPKSFPLSDTNFSAFYLSNVLKNKGYIYIDVKNYPIRPDGLTDLQAVGVHWVGRAVEHDSEGGTKKIKLNFRLR